MMLTNYESMDPLTEFFGNWLFEINIPSIIIRLLLAVIFGGVIGVERASKNHAAGFRTYILVCVSATIAMMTNQFASQIYNSDVARLGAQVITGVGFLGAGTILITSRNRIKGLTTAAGLWACACVGLAIGIGFYTLALISSILVLLSLTVLAKLEHVFTSRSKTFSLHIELASRLNLKETLELLRNETFKVKSIERNQAYASTGLSVYTITIETNKKRKNERKNAHTKIINLLENQDYVNYVESIN